MRRISTGTLLGYFFWILILSIIGVTLADIKDRRLKTSKNKTTSNFTKKPVKKAPPKNVTKDKVKYLQNVIKKFEDDLVKGDDPRSDYKKQYIEWAKNQIKNVNDNQA